MKRFDLIMFRCLIISVLFSFPAVTFVGLPPALALEDASWQNVLDHYRDAFHNASNDLRNYESKLDKQTRDFNEELAGLEKSKGQMMLWFGGSDDPDRLGYILRGISGLRLEADDLFRPFAEAVHELDDFAIKLEEIETEVRIQRGQTSTAEHLDALSRNLTNIEGLQIQMAGIKQSIENSREAYQNFLTHLEDAEKSTIRKTATYWKVFYLKGLPGLFSADMWEELPRSVEQWKTEMTLWWNALKSPDEASKFHNLLLRGLAFALAMILVGWVAAARMLKRLPQGFGAIWFLSAWIFLSAWASIAVISANVSFVLCPLVLTVCEFLLPSGLVFLHRFFRKAQNSGRLNPAALYLLWAASSIGLVLRTFVKSYGIALMLWIVCLLIFFMYLRRKAASSGSGLAKLHTAGTAYFLLLPCFLAVVGFLPLSLLLVSALFFATLTTGLGVDLARILTRLKSWAEQKYSEASSFFIGISAEMVFPVIFLSLIYVNLWLLSMRLGGDTVLHSILSTEAGWHDYHMSVAGLSLIILGFFITKSAVFVSEFLVTRLPSFRAEWDPAVVEALRTTIRYFCWGFFSICVLSMLGFNLMSLTVVAGGLSVGIGFGLQNIVNNLFSGLILLMGHSIQSGDTIQVGEMLGDVRKVTIRNTIVQTKDNATLFVPNSDLITNKLINWSHRDRRVIRKVGVGVAYGSDTEKVKMLLLRAAASHPSVLSDPAPEVLFSDFGASTLDFKVKFWIDDVDKELRVLSDVRYEINRLFRENEIEIAFPQSTLHLQTAPALEKLLDDRKREDADAVLRMHTFWEKSR